MSLLSRTNTFLRSSDWLGPEHLPAAEGLRAAARAVDNDFTAAALGIWRQLYVLLLDAKPEQGKPAAEDADPDLHVL